MRDKIRALKNSVCIGLRENQFTLTPLILIKWHFVFFSLLLSTQSVLACDDVENLMVASDEEALEVSPKREMRLIQGKPYKICNAFFRGIREHGLVVPGYCGIPLPSDDPDFSRLDWKLLNPMDHMDIIRDATITANFRGNNVGSNFKEKIKRAERFFDADDFPEDEIKKFWTPYKVEISRLIKAGEIKLWVANVDTDHNGVKEPFYRMTQIAVLGTFSKKAQKNWRERSGQKFPVSTSYPHCKDRGLEDGNNTYYYYVSQKDSPSAYRHMYAFSMGGHTEVFLWRGRIYYLHGGLSIHESKVQSPELLSVSAIGSTYAMAFVCGYSSKLISKK